MKHLKDIKLNIDNKGFSLIELIVVIAIMGILVGGVSVGINLVFSRDAEQCATRINDAIYSTRMYSMSKAGMYVLEIKDNNGGTGNTQYVATINVSTEKDSDDNYINFQNVETFYLEGDASSNTIGTITATLHKSSGGDENIALPLKITFDKSKGCVLVGSGYDVSEDGIVDFHIQQRRGNKDAHVNLVTATGKHKIGNF